MNEIFIFTECYNCGDILKKSLESFHNYHDLKVHIFGKKDDFERLGEIKHHPNNIFEDVTEDKELERLYQNGHAGTSYIFAKVFHPDNGLKNIIHFDSDTYFRNECISMITDEFENGYDIVGPIRCYKHNRNNRNDIRHQADTVSTYFFGMKNNILQSRHFDYFRMMCQGFVTPTNHQILDFFDPVTYDALTNGNAKIKFLDFEKVGNFNEEGSRNNKYSDMNEYWDVGDNIIHFAGCGSGYHNYVTNKTNSSYEKWSIQRYLEYMYILYNIKLTPEISPLCEKLNKLLNE